MKPTVLLALALSSLSAIGCGGTTTAQVADLAQVDSTTPVVAQYAIKAHIAFTADADGEHVSFGTQNGSTVKLLKSDLVGKSVYWIMAAGGEPVTNATPLDINIAQIAPDLTSSYTTPSHYAPGPYEVGCVVSVTGSLPPNIPANGDLAGFDNTPPPIGEPPLTGISVRVRIKDADTSVTLGNAQFVRFGTL